MDTIAAFGAPTGQFPSHTAPVSPPPAELDPEALMAGIERLTGFKEIDRGAYSVVYSATRFDDGAEVAVKIESRPLTDEARRQRFRHDIETAVRLTDHPCVVRMLAAGLTRQAHPYIVMERCRGSVAELIDRQGVVSPQRTIEIGIRLSEALAAAHSMGIVHRDIKPANILIDEYGRAVLSDFGISCLLADPQPGEPIATTATPAFAPLEVFQMREVGPSADIYSLAATLYTMLSGTPPRFPDGGVRDINEVVGLLNQPVPEIPGVSPLLLEMLRAALINNPDGRPTAEEFREFLVSIPEASTGYIPKVAEPAHQGAPVSPAGTFSAYSQPSEPDLSQMPERATVPDTPSTLRLAPARARRGERPRKPEPVRAAAVATVPAPAPPEAPDHPSTVRLAPPRARQEIEEPLLEAGPEPVPEAAPTEQWRAFSAGGELERDDPRLPVPAAEPEPVTTRRERRLQEDDSSGMGRLVGMLIAGAVILGLLVWGGIALFGGGDDDSADLAEQSLADEFVKECSLKQQDADCVPDPTCFTGAIDALSPAECAGTHQWEAYATGALPEGVSDGDLDAARENEVIASACLNGQREDGPLSQLIGGDAVDWTTDLHLPGDGTFMCVAQMADGSSVEGVTFARAT
ncbi:serine/threonine-protein kinase [Glycomyces salinus]|uniref:serine/threonine-protein kinase n=1 Tax=Glycomyces salinus TaxID=980294 RepID=UPI0018ECD81B|nr:serine/threonine-protein kinase [Glycomyces salinus]